nr:class I SAM-dependent methyltransferase [uncultured Actinoplanes sp.]
MTEVFGEVADLYDDVRPGYPDEVGEVIAAYAGARTVGTAVEVGAGTGKATRIFARLAEHLTAVEPDARMAGPLKAKLPQVEVVTARFEDWTPPAGGVDLVGCAMAWHWTDPATRNRRAFDALRPGGTLAIIGRKYGHGDPEQGARIDELLSGINPGSGDHDDGWVVDDLERSGLWTDVREWNRHDLVPYGKQRFLALHRTFSPYRQAAPEKRQRMMAGLGELLDDFGGGIVQDLYTFVVLAKR